MPSFIVNMLVWYFKDGLHLIPYSLQFSGAVMDKFADSFCFSGLLLLWGLPNSYSPSVYDSIDESLFFHLMYPR